MKKARLIHGALSKAIADLGHTDTLVIADAGLPIPPNTPRIDLALTKGVPSFLETVKVVLSEMHIERALVAEEMLVVSPEVHNELLHILGETPVETLKHPDFKARTTTARAIVRTGEYTPFANVILVSGAWGFGL